MHFVFRVESYQNFMAPACKDTLLKVWYRRGVGVISWTDERRNLPCLSTVVGLFVSQHIIWFHWMPFLTCIFLHCMLFHVL